MPDLVLLSLVLHKHVPTHKGGGLHVQECTGIEAQTTAIVDAAMDG